MIRVGTIEDLNVMTIMAQDMLTQYSTKPFAAKTIMANAIPVLMEHVDPEREDKVAFLECNESGTVRGVMLGFLNFYMCSEQFYATDRMFYVFPQYRDGLVLRRLVKAFEQWAKERKAFAVKLNVLGSRDNEVLLKLVQRWGYEINGYEVGKLL